VQLINVENEVFCGKREPGLKLASKSADIRVRISSLTRVAGRLIEETVVGHGFLKALVVAIRS
jgi:hypothetical protein